MPEIKDLDNVSFDAFTDVVDPAEIEDRLEKIMAYGEKMAVLDSDIVDLQAKIDIKNRELKNISMEVLPELLNEAGMTSFVLNNGKTVELTDSIQTSIIAAMKPQALQWLEDNGYGGMIKSNIVVSYPREEKALANKLMKQLQARKTVVSSDIKQEANVHAGTLKAWGKTMFEEGEGSKIPTGLFSTHRVKIAKVK